MGDLMAREIEEVVQVHFDEAWTPMDVGGRIDGLAWNSISGIATRECDAAVERKLGIGPFLASPCGRRWSLASEVNGDPHVVDHTAREVTTQSLASLLRRDDPAWRASVRRDGVLPVGGRALDLILEPLIHVPHEDEVDAEAVRRRCHARVRAGPKDSRLTCGGRRVGVRRRIRIGRRIRIPRRFRVRRWSRWRIVCWRRKQGFAAHQRHHRNQNERRASERGERLAGAMVRAAGRGCRSSQ